MEKAAGYSKLIRSWNFSLFPEQAEDPCPQPVDDGWIAPRREDHPCPDDHGAVEALLVVRALDREAQAEISELAEPHDASRLQFHVEHEVEAVEHRLDIGARDRASCADHLAKGIHVRVTVVLRGWRTPWSAAPPSPYPDSFSLPACNLVPLCGKLDCP